MNQEEIYEEALDYAICWQGIANDPESGLVGVLETLISRAKAARSQSAFGAYLDSINALRLAAQTALTADTLDRILSRPVVHGLGEESPQG